MGLELSMADGNITVEVSTQAAQDEMQRLTAELAHLREKVGLAYGYLWCVNNEPCAPDYMPPDRMAYEARKLLRDTMKAMATTATVVLNEPDLDVSYDDVRKALATIAG